MNNIEDVDLSKLEGLILDFDGVFWPNGFAPKSVRYEIFMNACGWAIKDLSSTSDSRDDIAQENLNLYLVHKEKCQDILCDKYQVDRIAFQRLYNRLARENFELQSGKHNIPCLKQGMELLKQSPIRYGILSHAHRDEYIRPYLDNKGLVEYMDPWNILGTGELHGKSKADGPEAYLMMLAILGTDPKKTMMVEDSPANLIWAKRLGMTTVWIHDGEPETLKDEYKEYIDIVADKFVDVLSHLNKVHPPQIQSVPSGKRLAYS